MRKQNYQILDRKDSRKLAEYLSKDGQLLLPLLELITNTETAVDDLIDLAGRATIEAVLILSAREVAGDKKPGRKTGSIGWHGRQKGVVALAERKLRVEKPRLRCKGRGPGKEVQIPAYEAMVMNSALGRRILEILMRGVSSRNYRDVLPEMAQTVGVSKSQISREFLEASEQSLKELCERRFDDHDILVIYLDGVQFGQIHVIAALGVDSKGYKHVLGLREGASENATVVTDLLEDLVARGIDPEKRYLFVIDGSKALHSGIDSVFGSANPVQRCRNHKINNVLDYLPKDMKDQTKTTMQAAFRLQADQGIAKLRKLAEWLDKEYPSAAASLREGLPEMFTVNRMGLPKSLHRCLCTTNIIESPHSGLRQKTRRVTRWRDGSMVLRWCASAMLATEKNFRRIMGYKQLWALEANLRAADDTQAVA
jgi:transposase-like protein